MPPSESERDDEVSQHVPKRDGNSILVVPSGAVTADEDSPSDTYLRRCFDTKNREVSTLNKKIVN